MKTTLCLSTDVFVRFWKRASANAPQATKERFVRTWREYLDAVILQASRRDDSRYICNVEEYLASRHYDFGIYPCLALMEMSSGLDIPHQIMEHPTIVSLARDATYIAFLSNVMIRLLIIEPFILHEAFY